MRTTTIGKATLHLCDCMDYMGGLSDNSFDLAIVDPPYGINVTSMNMGSRKTVLPNKKKQWDNDVPKQQFFDELKRVSDEQIIWGGNYFNMRPARCWLIWDKGESMYGRGFAEAEMAWTSMDKVVRLFKHSPNQLDRFHPTQKPVKLYEWLITNYSKQGQRIIDTHLGSGSSAIAANKLGFEFVGCEIDSDYYDAACERIENAYRQTKLFNDDVMDVYERTSHQANLLEGV